ncbi:hypothetical protein BDV96DRAFT_405678 [Lophiotrema nucula]|uniref:Uncharacterized protein n=1 Tax=Lophiotrema nucula TaxID=690887 RepID=A0A6A5ZFJ2_9PLEO|nr:hypothetical protein BDV96DRAFT_405678 [Lophiotrema nucula]
MPANELEGLWHCTFKQSLWSQPSRCPVKSSRFRDFFQSQSAANSSTAAMSPGTTHEQHPLHLLPKILGLPRELRDEIYHWIWQGNFVSFEQDGLTVFAYYGEPDLGMEDGDLPHESSFHHDEFREQCLKRFYEFARFVVGPLHPEYIIQSGYETFFRRADCDEKEKLRREDWP